jgi:nuclear pore complex protein Nup155
VSPAVAELPAMVQAKYRACQAMCFCGVFPEIRRAWASIDNSLFLWRYDRL